MTPDELDTRWREAWQAMGTGAPAPAVRDALLAAYQAPGRCYHTLQHLEECFRHFDAVADMVERPGELLVALWFHDAICDPRRDDNEEASARWAVEVVREAGAGREAAERIRGLILATRHDAPPPPGDSALLADIDLAILGASPSRFDEYQRQIRDEYAWVPETVFQGRRSRILASFAGRPGVFATEAFRSRHGELARENLRRALAPAG